MDAPEKEGAYDRSAASIRTDEELAGPLSRMLFLWVTRFVRQSYQEIQDSSLTLGSLPELPSSENPELSEMRLIDPSRLWIQTRRYP